MMKAAEDLKQQQLMKEQERQRILSERIVKLPNVDDINDTSINKLLLLLNNNLNSINIIYQNNVRSIDEDREGDLGEIGQSGGGEIRLRIQCSSEGFRD
jgi:hypothetical protein